MVGMMDSPGNPNPNYYQNVNYGNYQPYNVTGTVFGNPTGNYPTTTNVSQPSGGPPPQPGNPVAGGLFQAPNWLYNPQDAVVRAMRQGGMNPGSFNPMSQQILRNSQNLVSGLFSQAAGGQNDSWDVTDNQAMLNRLQAMIQQGASGGQVLGGVSPGTMANYSRANAANEAGTATASQRVIAEYLSDPSRALALTRGNLYSGMAPQFQTAAAAPLLNLGDYYQRLLEQGQDYGRSIIDVLLGAPVYGHAPGSQGVPLPFQASAWRYNP